MKSTASRVNASVRYSDSSTGSRPRRIGAERVRLDQMGAFLTDPGNRAMDLAVRYPHTAYEEVAQIGTLWQLEPARPTFPRAGPVLGEHTREVLREVGLEESEIESLLEAGVAVADDGRGITVSHGS